MVPFAIPGTLPFANCSCSSLSFRLAVETKYKFKAGIWLCGVNYCKIYVSCQGLDTTDTGEWKQLICMIVICERRQLMTAFIVNDVYPVQG